MLGRKLWRTMLLYKAQFLSMVMMITLGIGMFVGFNMEWMSIQKNTEKFFAETGFADYRLISEKGFSAEEAEHIAQIPGVDAVSRYLSLSVEVGEQEGDNVALTVTENPSVSGFVVSEGEEYDAESTDGIWLSARYAAANDIAVGDALTLRYSIFSVEGKVKGLVQSGEYMICVRDETQLMPDYTTYGLAYISPAMYKKAVGMTLYPQINVRSALDKESFTEAADKALGRTTMVLSKAENISYSGASGESDEGKTMGSVLPVLFLLIALLTMMTTMQRITAKERSQIGIMKALGFTDKKILRHYTAYAWMIGLVGCVFGTLLGYGVAWLIMNPNGMMGTYMDMPEWKLYMPWFGYPVLIGIIALLWLIGYVSVRRILQGSAAETLRTDVPEKVKHLLIERTAWFHRRSFGTRWNLRDVLRHKARTGMTLLGVVGCMVIVLCAFGMKDTLDAFMDLYYKQATNYQSRIYVDTEGGEKVTRDIAEQYAGDMSGSVSVQIGDKAVSLDIYEKRVEEDPEHDGSTVREGKVRFLDLNMKLLEPSDEGALICKRLADQFHLKPGDTFTVSPYGSDDTYTMTVDRVIRSVSEGITITTAYADQLGIDYTLDSVYTDVPKEDIASGKDIRSVQSKQMIVDSFSTMMNLMDLMVVILIIGAILLGVIVLYNLGIMSYTERSREMATLKVLGFKDKQIGKLLMGQNLWLSVVGAVLGIPLGLGVLYYLLTALAPEYELKLVMYPLSYAISILLTIGMAVLVSLLVSRRNKKIDMVEALKSAE